MKPNLLDYDKERAGFSWAHVRSERSEKTRELTFLDLKDLTDRFADILIGENGGITTVSNLVSRQ